MKFSPRFVSNLKKQHATTFNINVILRILAVLRETNKINRTNLAGRAGLNYNKCIRYVFLMQLLGWISVTSDEGHFVSITESGIDVMKRFEIFK